MTQVKLAKAAGVSVVTLYKAESGADVYPDTAKKLCDFLGLNLADTVVPIEEPAVRGGNGDGA